MIRIVLPFHLRQLAGIDGELNVDGGDAPTLRTLMDAVEARYPMLAGTIRDHTTQQRRPFLRFFACEEDLSHQSIDDPLPDPVTGGAEPLIVLAAIAGG